VLPRTGRRGIGDVVEEQVSLVEPVRAAREVDWTAAVVPAKRRHLIGR
jgi:hypothetical protein